MSIRILGGAKLSDGRPQLWAVDGAGKMFSTWQFASNGAWAEWTPFPSPPGAVRTLMGASLVDGRPQLWAVTTESGVFTTNKVSTNPDSGWTSWTKFKSPPT